MRGCYADQAMLPVVSPTGWDLSYLYPWNLLSLLLVTDKDFAMGGTQTEQCGHFVLDGRW